MPRFDLVQFLTLAQEHRATRLWVVPPIVLALAKHPIVDDYDLSAVRGVLSGAAPLGAELAAEASVADRCAGRAGLRHDRAEPGVARHPVGRRPARDRGRDWSPSCEARVVDPGDR